MSLLPPPFVSPYTCMVYMLVCARVCVCVCVCVCALQMSSQHLPNCTRCRTMCIMCHTVAGLQVKYGRLLSPKSEGPPNSTGELHGEMTLAGCKVPLVTSCCKLLSASRKTQPLSCNGRVYSLNCACGPGGVTKTGPDATPPPSHLSKLAGGEGGGGQLGREGGGGGIGSSARGGGAAHNPLLPHAYLKGVCVSGGMGV